MKIKSFSIKLLKSDINISKVTLNTWRHCSQYQWKSTHKHKPGDLSSSIWNKFLPINNCGSLSLLEESTSFEKNLRNKQESNLRCYQKRYTTSFPRWFTPHKLADCLNWDLISYVPHLYWPLCKSVNANAEKTQTAGALQPISDAVPIKVALLPFLNKVSLWVFNMISFITPVWGLGGYPDRIQSPSWKRCTAACC